MGGAPAARDIRAYRWQHLAFGIEGQSHTPDRKAVMICRRKGYGFVGERAARDLGVLALKASTEPERKALMI